MTHPTYRQDLLRARPSSLGLGAFWRRMLALVATCQLVAPASWAEDGLTMRAVLARAATANPSVLSAKLRVRQARAGLEARKADQVPDLDIADSHSYTNRDFPGLFSTPKYAHQVAGTLKQRVLSGGTLPALVRVGRGLADEAEANYRESLQSVLDRVANSFLDVLEQSETQKTLQEAITTQKRRLEDIQARIDAGVMLETNRLSAEITLLEEERQLLVSRTSQALAEDTLRVLLALPEGSRIRLEDALDPLTTLDTATLSATDLDESPTVQRVEARIRQAEAQVAAARGAFKPQVDVSVSQIHFANGLNFASQDANFLQAMGQVNLPVFDGGRRRSGLHEARRGLEASRLEARTQRDELTILRGQALLGIQEAEARKRAGEVRIDLAQRNRDIVQERYIEGAAIQSEILDADVEWRRARLEVITSRYQILRQRVRLLRLSGHLARLAMLGAGALEEVQDEDDDQDG